MRGEDNNRRAIHQLKELAVNGLVQMFDSERQLFCLRLKQTAHGLVRQGISRRETLIALLGLHQLEASGTASPIAIKHVLNDLLVNINWVKDIGDLGLLLWLCALEAPQRMTEIESHLGIESSLEQFRGARQRSTTELAWFLSGLSHRHQVCPEKQPDLREVAFETYRRLRNNQGEFGIFRHTGRKNSIARMFRGRIGSFADQVHSIYAIATFVRAYHTVKEIETALDCALTLCQIQGPRGQWWWRYDSGNGRVVESYPVLSVHQDGMAPIALFALGEAVHSDFNPWIYKGLQWVNGDNEMDVNMSDASTHVVRRGIARSTVKSYWNMALTFLSRGEDHESRDGLSVLFECRPHHYGWLLYAFANRDDTLPAVAAKRPTGNAINP